MNERELFENNEFVKTIIHRYEWSDEFNNYQIKDCVINGNVFNFIEAERDQPILNGAWFGWQVSVQREGYKLVPCNPTEEMWGGLARHLVKYMQSHDRYCPKTLGKYISRFIGIKNIPDWLNKEVPNWESDHAFATADLGVFIYKAMIDAIELK